MLLREPAVGFRANAPEKEETEGPLVASGQRYGACTLFCWLRLGVRGLLQPGHFSNVEQGGSLLENRGSRVWPITCIAQSTSLAPTLISLSPNCRLSLGHGTGRLMGLSHCPLRGVMMCSLTYGLLFWENPLEPGALGAGSFTGGQQGFSVCFWVGSSRLPKQA